MTEKIDYTPEFLADYTSGRKPWPHFDPIEDSAERDKALTEFLWASSAWGHSATGKLRTSSAGPGYRPPAALYGFRGYGMTARNGGDGIVLYERSYPHTSPGLARFAICKHEFVAGAGANPSRGWHPSKCKHCGLDNSIDSGD